MIIWPSETLREVFADCPMKGDIPGISGLEIDTRRMKGGEMFLAFPGKQVDGHDYLADAAKKGAKLALVEIFQDQSIPQICVPNMREALWRLASYARDKRSKTCFIAITGSVGKTSTRGLMHQFFSLDHRVYASHGNFNNDLGMPMCLAQMGVSQDWDVAIFELGMSAAGELTPLSQLLRPNIALIVNVRSVHQEFFESIAGIARAKAEIFAGLSEGGLAVIPNQPEFANIFAKAVRRDAEILCYNDINAPYFWHDDALWDNENGTCMIEQLSGQLWRFRDNILAIAQIYRARFGDPKKAIAHLTHWQPEAGRGQVVKGLIGDAHITVMDDSYNASLSSMLACLADLQYMEGIRKIAVLGEMKELGNATFAIHQELIARLNAYQFDAVFVAGETFVALKETIDHLQMATLDAEELVVPLKSFIQTGDVVAFKGSLSVGLSRVIAALEFSPEKQR